MKKWQKVLIIVLTFGVMICFASTAFACMPPWWGAEEELPEDMSKLYRGKVKTKTNRFQDILMKGYQAKSFN